MDPSKETKGTSLTIPRPLATVAVEFCASNKGLSKSTTTMNNGISSAHLFRPQPNRMLTPQSHAHLSHHQHTSIEDDDNLVILPSQGSSSSFPQSSNKTHSGPPSSSSSIGPLTSSSSTAALDTTQTYAATRTGFIPLTDDDRMNHTFEADMDAIDNLVISLTGTTPTTTTTKLLPSTSTTATTESALFLSPLTTVNPHEFRRMDAINVSTYARSNTLDADNPSLSASESSVAGATNITAAVNQVPPLTTINNNIHRLGYITEGNSSISLEYKENGNVDNEDDNSDDEQAIGWVPEWNPTGGNTLLNSSNNSKSSTTTSQPNPEDDGNIVESRNSRGTGNPSFIQSKRTAISTDNESSTNNTNTSREKGDGKCLLQ